MKSIRPFFRALTLLSLLAVGGCSSSAVLKQFTAGVDDHEAYRRARTATNRETQLVLAWRYLVEFPQGQYIDDVRRVFSTEESRHLDEANTSISMLERYLVLLPDAPGVERAEARLEELLAGRHAKARRARALATRGRELNRKLDDADRLRVQLIAGFNTWLRLLTNIRTFGHPTSALEQELLVAYRMTEPAARCRGERCYKMIDLPYLIPDHGKLRPRQAVFDVVLELDQGRVKRARLSGSDLFSRIGEASEKRPVEPGDGLARAESIGRAVQIAAVALERTLPSNRCARDAVSPVVLHRACDGIEARLVAALEPGGEDQMIVQATTRTAKPPDPAGD